MQIVSGLRNIWNSEKSITCWIRIYSRLCERINGGFRAWIYGWPQGFIGDSPRIIGTAFIKVGQKCSIGRFSWIETIVGPLKSIPILEIGEHFSASERFHVACMNQVRIGDRCLVGSGVHITDHNHGNYKDFVHSLPTEPPIQRRLVSSGPVIIGDRVWIGDNVVIIGPANIGDGAILGANSVVSGVIAAQTMVGGAPARVLKIFNADSGRWEQHNPDQ